MTYIDGFVLLVKKGKLKEYTKLAKDAAKAWKKNGALGYYECLEDEMNPDTQGMPMLPFPKLTKRKPGEKIIFAFILYKNKKHRDAVNKRVMKDPEMLEGCQPGQPIPFDLKKMAWGGFKTIVEVKK